MFSKSGKKRPIKREFSAGGAVFRGKVPRVAQVSRVPRELEGEWLLIRQRGSKEWRLPKGNIEKGERAGEAAVREVKEETGVLAKTLEKVDTIQYFYFFGGTRIFKTVTFFLMECVGGNPRIDSRWQHEIEEVKWLPGNQALKSLSFKSEKGIIKKATLRLGKRSWVKLV